jgi:hypothetical protein
MNIILATSQNWKKKKKKKKTLQVKASWLGFTGIRALRQRAGVEPLGNFGT